ncbi:MAG TPA: SDR family oxidoreductase [Spirochaetota bacterium]|nr:SDR family oxidoreductase [Spirochaetota bacterium]
MNILLTGATGYIGRRLLVRLLSSVDNINLRLLVTDKRQVDETAASRVEIVEGNTFNASALKNALKGIDTAYYLIHSMRTKKGDFVDLDRLSAENFIQECAVAGVKRIIYLGGLGEKNSLSRHIVSRQETGEILSSCPDKVEVIWFRAAIIIGAGGASYEIIKDLVQKLPVMLAPSWVRTLTQPVAVDDVITYLIRALKTDFRGSTVIDIGGEKLTFLDMLKQASKFYSLKRLIIPIPFFSPKISSYWLILLTPVPFKLASALVAGLKTESVIKNSNAEKFFPDIKPISYMESIRRAADEEVDEIVSHWSDGSSAWFHSGKKAEQSESATHTSSYHKNITGLNRKRLWESILSIGGERGWLSMNILWNIRGVIDKFSGGPGINRGRRFSDDLRIGDSIDFWTVVDLIHERRLLLSAQMKLPGKAWLEFIINNSNLRITAYFIPRGVYGRLYWYILLPFHGLIFKGMLRRIIEDSTLCV